MQQDRAAGFALIGGTLAGLVTMALHPTGHALAGDFASVAPINRTVHSLAIAGTIITFYGLVRLSRGLARTSVTDAALVAYGFGGIAVMFAAIASGFIATDITAIVLEKGGEAQALYEPARDFGWALNQASTRVFVVASSAAIALWSSAMLREPWFGRPIGFTGILIGILAIAATLLGMPMNIHGFGAIVLGQGIWLIWTGSRLLATR